MVKYFIFCMFFLLNSMLYSQNKIENEGLFYDNKAYDFNGKHQIDSAYIYYKKAQKIYEIQKDSLRLTTVLLNLSILQSNQRDYNGSENNSIKALKIAKVLQNKLLIAECYKKLGILAKDQQHFSRAIGYHKTALDIANSLQKGKLQIALLTSIGITYKEKKEYANAILNFNKAIHHDSITKYPKKQARVLDYIGYCNFKLGKIKNLPKQFLLAKRIQEKINHKQGIVTSNLHLAEFYLSQKNKEKAKIHLMEAKLLAEEIQDKDAILTALKFLAEANPKNATSYFKTYTNLNNSILQQQAKQKEQFSRIKFETNQKEEKIELQKNALQSKNFQQKMLLFILGLSIASLLIFSLVYKKLKSKNKQITNLQKEIHHRVKNNLAMVNRFIAVSKKKTTNKEALENYTTLNNRLETIKSIHELLYKNKHVGIIDLQQFITKIGNLTSVVYKNEIEIKTHINAPIFIDSKISEPIGLIINELITNCYKYAFTHTNNGNIYIDCCIKDKNILLSVSDDGVGFPKNLDISKIKSYGLKLVSGLTKQLNGNLKLIPTKIGSKIELIIPK